jgi:hypothetical protein
VAKPVLMLFTGLPCHSTKCPSSGSIRAQRRRGACGWPAVETTSCLALWNAELINEDRVADGAEDSDPGSFGPGARFHGLHRSFPVGYVGEPNLLRVFAHLARGSDENHVAAGHEANMANSRLDSSPPPTRLYVPHPSRVAFFGTSYGSPRYPQGDLHL